MAQTISPMPGGTGRDGDITYTVNTTVNTCRAAVSGTTIATNSVKVSALSTFAVGDLIMIHQSRGNAAGIGQKEFHRITAIVNNGDGTYNFTLDSNLTNTYTTDTDNRAQVIRAVEARNLIINAGVNIMPPNWDGATGGWLVLFVAGTLTRLGIIRTQGAGFRGASFDVHDGEGYLKDSVASDGTQNSQTGSGGASGGGWSDGNPYRAAGGGGGGSRQNGSDGLAGNGNASFGRGGHADPSTDDCTVMLFGGGGGTGGHHNGPPNFTSGSSGSGCAVIYANRMIGTGLLILDGAPGVNVTHDQEGGSGAGGAGKAQIVTLSCDTGTGLATANSAIGGTGDAGGGNGGAGSPGSFRIESCSIAGSTSPAASTVLGNLPWCGVIASKQVQNTTTSTSSSTSTTSTSSSTSTSTTTTLTSTSTSSSTTSTSTTSTSSSTTSTSTTSTSSSTTSTSTTTTVPYGIVIDSGV